MRSPFCALVLGSALGVAGVAWADGKDTKDTAAKNPAAVLEQYLENEFPEKVIRPAILRTLQRLFRDEESLNEQVKDAVQAALTSQSVRARERLIEMVEAIGSRDRTTYETAAEKFLKIIGSRRAYLDKSIKKLVPDITGRARPLARVSVARNYNCDARFLGTALGFAKEPKEAEKKAQKMKHTERTELCAQVRRWAEAKGVQEVDRFVDAMARDLKGEKVDLGGKEGEETAALVRKALERELIVFVGNYKEAQTRIHEGLQKLAAELPKPPEKKEAEPAAEKKGQPAPEKKEEAPE